MTTREKSDTLPRMQTTFRDIEIDETFVYKDDVWLKINEYCACPLTSVNDFSQYDEVFES